MENQHHKYTPDDIIAYLLGVLPPERLPDFEAERLRNPKFERTVAAFKNKIQTSILQNSVINTTQQALHPTFWQRFARLSVWVKAAISGTILMAVITAAYFFFTKNDTLVYTPTLSVQALDSLPIFECPTDAIPQKLVNDKEYTAAAIAAQLKIDTLLTKDKTANIADLQLIVGVCTTLSPDYAKSRTQQENALTVLQSIKNDDYKAQIMFYSALIHARLGHTDTAKATLQNLIKNPEFKPYKNTAQRLLDGL